MQTVRSVYFDGSCDLGDRLQAARVSDAFRPVVGQLLTTLSLLTTHIHAGNTTVTSINRVGRKLMAGVLMGSACVIAPPQVLAQTSVIEEVIVTARKREETLQDISAAVSVVDSSRLQQNVVNDVRDLQTIVPNITVGETIGIMKVNIRGLGNSTVTRAEDSEVVLHVDGAVVSRMETQSMTFFDLDRIEVLRGPQGTLYGRNSTGGTINLVTAKPTEEFEGYVNLNVGNYDFLKAETALSGPLTDHILARVALQSTQRGGYAKNINTGNEIQDDERWAGRLHLQFNISDDVQFLLSGEYATQDDASGHFTFLGPLFDNVTPPGAGGFSDPSTRDGSFSFDPQMEKETWSVTGTLDWSLNDNYTVRNILNYRELDFFVGQDLDHSSVSNVTAVGLPADDEQYSEELQLLYEGENLHAIAGLYYFREKYGGSTNIGRTPTSETFFTLLGDSDTEVWAPFFNVTYDLNDRFAIRVGGRYNNETREITNDSVLNGNLITTDNDIADDKRSASKYTGEYGIDFHISDNNMLYYTFSQGFRSGAGLVFQSNSPIIDPTTVDNHEIGWKVQSSDGRFSAALAIFDATINDLQRTQASLNPNGTLNTRVNNINEMDTQGVELDLSWAATDRFRLSAAVAYLEAEFKDFLTDDPLVFGSEIVQVAGNTPNLAPDWKGNLHGEYDFSLANNALLTASGDISYIGEQFFDEFNREPFVEESYTLVDASLTYRPSAGNWSVALWGKNLGDEKKLADTNFSAFGGVRTELYIPPLTWGVSVNVNF